MLKKIFLLFLAWRIFLFVPLIFSHFYLSARVGYPYTTPLYFLNNLSSSVSNFLVSPFGNFDGVYYLIIAIAGYTVDNAGFFPVFPLSIKLATSIFGNLSAFDEGQYFTALTLVSLYFLLSLLVMYKLIRFDYKDKIAIQSVIFLLLFPSSFFFVSIYSESLFLFLSLLTFYLARKKRWILASICGGLLTATRFVGIAILPALIYEFIKEEKTLVKTKALSLLLVPLGLIGYMLFNFQKFGNALQFIVAQGELQNQRSVSSIVFFPQTIYRYLKILTTVSFRQYEWWTALLELSVFVFVALMLFVAFKKKIRPSYLIFAAIAFLIPVSSGTFSGLPRYILALFPIFIALALLKNLKLKIIYSIVSFILLFLLFALFSQSYFIA